MVTISRSRLKQLGEKPKKVKSLLKKSGKKSRAKVALKKPKQAKKAVKKKAQTARRGDILQEIQEGFRKLRAKTMRKPKTTRATALKKARKAKRAYTRGPQALKERFAEQGGLAGLYESLKAKLGPAAQRQVEEEAQALAEQILSGDVEPLERTQPFARPRDIQGMQETMGEEARDMTPQNVPPGQGGQGNISLGKARAKRNAISPMPSSWVQAIGYDDTTEILYAALGDSLDPSPPKDYYWRPIPLATYTIWIGGMAACTTNDPSGHNRWRPGKRPSLGAAWWHLGIRLAVWGNRI